MVVEYEDSMHDDAACTATVQGLSDRDETSSHSSSLSRAVRVKKGS